VTMPRVLIVEDDPTQLCLRKQLLELGGYRTLTAMGPGEALRLQEQADVVVTDLRFPGLDGKPDPELGLELIRNLRAANGNLPLVVLSGWPDALYGRPEERMVSLVLVKPVSLQTLLETIERLAGASGSVGAPGQSLPSIAK
jgi:CheY-like chemotaxis protein